MLLSTHSSANKSTTDGLSIRYKADVVSGGKIKVARFATKSYSYTGMTRAAANACADAKRAQYTTNHVRLTSETETEEFFGCQAAFRVFSDRVGWSCEISVNETDYAIADEEPVDPSALFSGLIRDYDESDTYALYIKSFTSGKFTISHGLIPLPEIILEYRTPTMTGWRIVQYDAESETVITPSESDDGYYRLRWGTDIIGNVFQVKTETN